MLRPFSTLPILLFLAACGPGSGAPSSGEPACEAPPATPVTVQRPSFTEGEYAVELERWGISADGTNAEATTDGINAAIRWAAAQGFQRVRLPAGTYLVGKRLHDHYTGGIELVSDMALFLDDGAVVRMVPNETWA
ncbi:MAG TPA: hypothetical protein VGD74_02050, partial [Vulgatibacter sp.]